jgi:hypothetical protein
MRYFSNAWGRMAVFVVVLACLGHVRRPSAAAGAHVPLTSAPPSAGADWEPT